MFSISSPIAGTPTPYLYQSEHWHTGPFQYQFTVPNGVYTVRLKFAEIYFIQAGQRSFNVAINGEEVLTNFDVYKAAANKQNTATLASR